MGPMGLLGRKEAVKQISVLKQECLRPLTSQGLFKMLILSGLKEPVALTAATPLDLKAKIDFNKSGVGKSWENAPSFPPVSTNSPELDYLAISADGDVGDFIVVQIPDAVQGPSKVPQLRIQSGTGNSLQETVVSLIT